jgi:hypothetical protein
MAVKEKEAQTEAAEAIAKSRKFYQEYSGFKERLGKFVDGVHALDGVIVQLLNMESAIDARIKAKEIDLARIEKECHTRLSNMERGQRDLTDRLTKKEVEAENKAAEAEKTMALANRIRQEAETVKASYERKLDGLSQVSKK